jgi:hypothetical protein
MELALNLGWLLLALWMICLWLRFAPRTGHSRRAQIIALALVILILLPAISMSDDLAAAQNPAEMDTTCLRRDHDWSAPHPIVPATTALVVAFFAGLLVEPVVRARVPGELTAPAVSAPALASIENRPPPAA